MQFTSFFFMQRSTVHHFTFHSFVLAFYMVIVLLS